jgi:hypothetical protein
VSDITRAKDGLLDILKEEPGDRRAVMMLARIFYEKEHDVDAAIRALSEFIDNSISADVSEHDIADVLYNKACYLTLKAAHLNKEGAASTEIDDLRREAFLALERSISLSPANASDAASDPDLETIRDTEQFRLLVRSA